MNWELIHRLNSMVLGAFIVTHIGVHLMAVASPQAHAMGLEFVRQGYAAPWLEAVLLVSIVVQIYSGYMELKLFGKKGWRLVRNLSGSFLMIFLLAHTGATLVARHIDQIPTDFYWVAGSLSYAPLKYLFMVWYGLGVFSFVAHMVAVLALHWKSAPKRLPGYLLAGGAGIAALIILAFSGMLYDIELPADVEMYYKGKFAPLIDDLDPR